MRDTRPYRPYSKKLPGKARAFRGGREKNREKEYSPIVRAESEIVKMKQVKIHQLEIENVKRVKAVTITPEETGMTIIGGNNNQGKTSVLDAIAWGLGGDRYKPSAPVREGSVVPPHIRIELSNGLIVERTGKNSALKVIDPNGRKSGQQLLNEFVEALALDLPKFMNQSGREKAQTLLKIIGVGEQLFALEQQETALYNQRHAVGQEALRKKKYAEELPVWPDVPKEPVSASELIRRQQDILARNGENRRKREQADLIGYQRAAVAQELARLKEQAEELSLRIQAKQSKYEQLERDEATARKTAAELQDESTEELERDLAGIDAVNVKVRANLDREKAEQDAAQYQERYDKLTEELEDVRKQKLDLLHHAALPLPGLSVENGELTYNGHRWDAMSGSDQLRVSTAIVRAINPKCGFVLLDKLEQMDMPTLHEFGRWLNEQGLQAIATRVSTGDECSLIIEDGYSMGNTDTSRETLALPKMNKKSETAPKWQKGVF